MTLRILCRLCLFCLFITATAVGAQQKILKLIPQADLRTLDPIATTAYITRNHGYMVYDTLFATDAKFQIKPQMVDRCKKEIASAILRARLPGIFPYREFDEDGALMSYSVDNRDVGHKSARYIDRLLKGAKPVNLPIEQISTYKLVIDLRIARDMKINVPQPLLLRADEVIR